jgi:hypothetical protein
VAYEVTGFGALDAVWNAHHVADRRFEPGRVYDPDPTLGGGQFNSRFVGVDHENGRVLGYEMRLPPRTTLSQAIQVGLSQLPTDTRIRWRIVRTQCALVDAVSRLLGQALASPKIGDPSGEVLISMWTETPAGDNASLNRQKITNMNLGLGSWPKAADAPDC